MPKPTYTAADFMSPKVKGLAVHAAKLITQASEDIKRDRATSFSIPPLETQSYCLFGVAADVHVFPIAAAPTSSDIAPIIRVGNLKALAAKYRLIGFVMSRVPKKTREYEPIPAPIDGKVNPDKGAKGVKGTAGRKEVAR